jgi:hypothetical protein
MAFSINQVRNLTLFLLNKNNRGYVGVDEFNSFCQLAQMDIFESLFYQYNQFINKENKRLTGSEYANIPKNLREQIDVFAEYTTQNNFIYNSATNLWSYTGNDLYRTENLSLAEIATNKKIDVQEVQKRELNVMNNSSLTAPSLLFPCYERVGGSFRLYPNVPSGYYAEMFYLRNPKNPKWTFTLVGGNAIYNASASDLQNIELHISLFDKFITKVLSYCGLSVREESVQAVANSEEMNQWQTQNQP